MATWTETMKVGTAVIGCNQFYRDKIGIVVADHERSNLKWVKWNGVTNRSLRIRAAAVTSLRVRDPSNDRFPIHLCSAEEGDCYCFHKDSEAAHVHVLVTSGRFQHYFGYLNGSYNKGLYRVALHGCQREQRITVRNVRFVPSGIPPYTGSYTQIENSWIEAAEAEVKNAENGANRPDSDSGAASAAPKPGSEDHHRRRDEKNLSTVTSVSAPNTSSRSVLHISEPKRRPSGSASSTRPIPTPDCSDYVGPGEGQNPKDEPKTVSSDLSDDADSATIMPTSPGSIIEAAVTRIVRFNVILKFAKGLVGMDSVEVELDE